LASFDLAEAIPAGATVLADTSVVLAYLAGVGPSSAIATQFFDAFVSTGRNRAVLSTVTVEEILVRPFRRSPAAVATAEGFLRHFTDIRLVAVGYEVAREAARIRAIAGLRTPDALILATAIVADVDLVVTGDGSWSAAAEASATAMRVLVV
jgi:predicted nucleic acid-binding protein